MIGCIGHDGDCCKCREQTENDAARYRWLRDANASLEWCTWYVGIDDGNPDGIHWVGADLDSAIDDAISAQRAAALDAMAEDADRDGIEY